MVVDNKLALSEPQIEAIEAINQDYPLILLPSKSGSGKTFILVKMVEALQPKSGRYLAYGKKVAVEAQRKLSHTNVIASTLHAMAHQAVMGKHSTNTGELINGKLYKRFIGSFSELSIRTKFKTVTQVEAENIVLSLKKFFLSIDLTFVDFLNNNKHNLSKKAIDVAIKYMKLMRTGHAPCIHDFYLKLYHASLVSGEITPKQEDVLMIDEAGDLAAVSYAIFMAYPATKKVMAGDKYQNIFSFNHTINAFDLAKDIGHTISFDKTFRVDKHLAESIQWFCQEHIAPDFVFVGDNITDKTIRTTMYITRTNASLIAKMVDLNQRGIGYNVARKVSLIFESPLLLLSMKSNPEILVKTEFDFLIPDINRYNDNQEIHIKHPSLLGYIMSIHSKNIQIKSAISLILKFGPKSLFEARDLAIEYEQSEVDYPLLVGTVHSLKGAESDSVELDDDLNIMVDKVIRRRKKTKDDYTSLLLYYVAISRARIELINAKYLH